jgi:GT2 family glycosyltransferase
MIDTPSLSIIIPVRNGRRFLPACLDSLRTQIAEAPELTITLIAVDNASVDGSASWIASTYPEVQLIVNLVNRGFSGACNQGLLAAPTEIAILLNQDTEVAPGWVRAIVNAFADPVIGIVGCKIYYPDGKTLQHAGGYIERPQMFGRHYGYQSADQTTADHSRPVEWVTGAAFAIHRRVIDRIGLLDEGFWPGYFEDIDYCLRAQAVGFRVWYCAEAVLSHQETSSKIDHESIQRFYHRGRLRFALKHLPPSQLVGEMLAVEWLDIHRTTPARQAAYWQARLIAPTLLTTHWQADEQQIEQVMAALRRLIEGELPPPEPAPMLPAFSEVVFPVTMPVLGPLLSKFRQLWYNVAARWGVQHLERQQNVVNNLLLTEMATQNHALREQTRLLRQNTELLQHQVDQLALDHAALAQQLSMLQSVAPGAQESMATTSTAIETLSNEA